MKFTRCSTIAASIVAAAFSAPGFAQEAERGPVIPSVRVSSEATVTVKPDQAQIDLGVISQAQTARAASSQNALELDRVLKELRNALGPNADIKTVSYSLSPNYRFPREGERPTITGYTATNIVQVRVDNLADVAKVIDLATQSGANTIQRLQFLLKDEQAVQQRALREAAVKARAKADALAAALGLEVARILSIVESGLSPPPVRELAMRAESRAIQTPVEPGSIEVRATVTLTAEVRTR